ncbi:hypothetical protein AcetOrient_orf01235 [Acetobacter orientalis]|uniref:Uncharacterized protein n=1 Tax=Acetobacter orientalis TaxID=146474 RepID=A0A2Z5ZEZ8_9PROT|nr:hypothetical protein AcetOrient_orf01235 [Acetobacter orientalis]
MLAEAFSLKASPFLKAGFFVLSAHPVLGSVKQLCYIYLP